MENRIAEMLKAQKRRHISFHTPGHKRPGADITELSYSDNLASPKGVLSLAEREVAEILGADKSFLLTDGSTSGVLSMIYAFRLAGGKKLALPVFSHGSALHACKALGVSPVWIFSKTSFGIPEQPSEKEIEKALQQADGLFLTSPDYYGFLAPLSFAKELCKEAGKPLLVDGAHGGHLHFTNDHAGKFADLWVDGVHKSLPALTQGAVVSAKGEWVQRLQTAVKTFRTTSPSYPILASVEAAVKFPRNLKIETLANEFKKQYGCVKNDDWTKVLVPFGACARDASEMLEKKGIYAEFCDGNYLLFYLSPCTKPKELKILGRELCRLPRGKVERDAPCGEIPMYDEGT